MPEAKIQFAFDKSTRRIDADGRLHVEVSNISKANVCPYFGKEIPNSEMLGLEPNRIYQLLRDPEELERAAPTFNNIQLLSVHIPVSADDPQKSRVIGTTGDKAEFVRPYLRNSLAIWDAEAIAGIESGEQEELSSSYRYRADMTPGEFDGKRYDGVMRDIIGNHVAIVEKGRAGPDVVVGDQKPFIDQPEIIKMPIPNTPKARRAALTAALAQDKSIDGDALLKKFAHDAAEEEDDKRKQAEDETDEEYEARMKKMDEEDEEDKKTEDEAEKDDDKVDKKAMDAAIQAARSDAEKSTIARMQAIRQAEKEVAPHIGEIAAMDSAEAVYKMALDAAKVDLTGVHPSAYRAMVSMLTKPGDARKKPKMAQDAANVGAFGELFPNATRLVRTL